jgi:hypothetical protein
MCLPALHLRLARSGAVEAFLYIRVIVLMFFPEPRIMATNRSTARGTARFMPSTITMIAN